MKGSKLLSKERNSFAFLNLKVKKVKKIKKINNQRKISKSEKSAKSAVLPTSLMSFFDQLESLRRGFGPELGEFTF